MNDDNDESRRMVEMCYRTKKTLVNPIVDWTDEDVWEFLNDVAKVPHCSLYDEGFKRLGCIGCPLAGAKNMKRDFERWPKYKELYLLAFEKMIANHPGQIRILKADDALKDDTPPCQVVQGMAPVATLKKSGYWKPEEIMRWWINEKPSSSSSGG